MFGFNEAMLSFLRRSVGVRTDNSDPNGSLHAKTRVIGIENPTANTTTVMGYLRRIFDTLRLGGHLIEVSGSAVNTFSTITVTNISGSGYVSFYQLTVSGTSRTGFLTFQVDGGPSFNILQVFTASGVAANAVNNIIFFRSSLVVTVRGSDSPGTYTGIVRYQLS